jgi:ubiquinone/menaquinone biosynthesis C-methylase UbiE
MEYDSTSAQDREIIDHFGSIAKFYSGNYHDDSPTSHLFSTRLKRVFELTGNICDKKIIDVGCGPGMTAEGILAKGGKFFGVDLSNEMLLECVQIFDSLGTLNLSLSNIKRLPFPKASFDVIICLGVLEYVPELDMVLQELYRILKKDGVLIVSMQNKLSPYRLWDRHVYRSDFVNQMRKRIWGSRSELLLERPNSFQKFQNLLLNNHFTVKDYLYYNFNLWLRPLDRLFPKLSVFTSQRLEFLCRSKLGVLGTGFIVKAGKNY